jgi:putative methionine-R-sulfoxide reductase with GAF domain
MQNRKEDLFKLQVFQQTISTLYMYPLRIYKNDCYDRFEETLLHAQDLQKLYELITPNKSFDFKILIKNLKNIIKENPKIISLDSEVYKILDHHSEKLREVMWETQASNSLIFTREIKDDKRLWIFLMIYDLFSKEFIDKNFETPYSRKCLVGMQELYIKLNTEYTLSIGGLFTEKEQLNSIVKDVLQKYDFDNMNMFELLTLSKKRRTFDMARLEEKTSRIKNAFRLFFQIKSQLPFNIDKEELEVISIFIYMLSRANNLAEEYIKTKRFKISFSKNRLTINAYSGSEQFSENFISAQLKFKNNRDFFRGEYASRLKSTLVKKYTGLKNYDSYSPVKDLLKHISNRLNADGASFVKYNPSNEQLTLEAIHGDERYEKGIERIVGQINRKEPYTFKRSRVLKIIESYYNDDYKYNIEKLILKDLNHNKILQPVKDKPIYSNIAIPITLQHKLLGVLLIDSFRTGSFTQDDMNLIFSISTALSVQIFDQIVENNLSSIMENLPKKAELDNKSINEYFSNLTRDINNIFFAYGVSIWKYSEERRSFVLKATTLALNNTSPIEIQEDSGELIIELIDNFDDYLSVYDIEKSNLLKSCNPINFNPRINCLRIYPIVREGELIGAFSVYNHSKADYRAIDAKSLESVTKHLIIFFNTLDVLNAQRALTKTEALHEIHSRLNMLEDKTKQLRKLVNIDFKELEHYARYRFLIKLDDINNLVSNTRISFNYIANTSNKMRGLNHVDDEVINLYKPLFIDEPQINNIRYMFNELSNSIPSPYNNKNIRINNMINEQINLKVHNLILSDIFQNILLNAVKYSFQGTTIRIYSKEKAHSINIFIKNDGLPIREDEEIDIFKYGYRGFSTKGYVENIDGEDVSYEKRDKENLGIGLYKSNELVKKILVGEIYLKREKSTLQGAEVNTFEIMLPKKLLEKGKR